MLESVVVKYFSECLIRIANLVSFGVFNEVGELCREV